jgi:hypothetical protein
MGIIAIKNIFRKWVNYVSDDDPRFSTINQLIRIRQKEFEDNLRIKYGLKEKKRGNK